MLCIIFEIPDSQPLTALLIWLSILGNCSEKLHCGNAVNMPYYNNYTPLLQRYQPAYFSVQQKTAAPREIRQDQDHLAVIPLILVKVREAADRAKYQLVHQNPEGVNQHPAHQTMVASKEWEAIGAGSAWDCRQTAYTRSLLDGERNSMQWA